MAVEVPNEFLNFLRTESARADDATLNAARAVALRAYQGDKYGDEEEGRSQAVTRDVSEVVDNMLTGMLGTIMAGGKAVEFDTEPEEQPDPSKPPNPDGSPALIQIDYGAEATAAIHYQFMRRQKGYRILHDAGKAGMLEKTGITKTFPEQTFSRQEVTAPRMAFNDDGTELQGAQVVSAEPIDDPEYEAAAAMGLATEAERPHRAVVKVPNPIVIRDVNIPNEWFMISPDANDLDEAQYVGDKMPVTVSYLVSLGYDHAEMLEIWGSADSNSVVEQARDADRGNDRDSIGSGTGANRLLWLYQEYPLYDLDGDGIAERHFVHRIGQHVLRVMPVDEQPYSGWTPFPMQHRFTGQSVADKTMDVQRITTVLLRQFLDATYLTTAPRYTINMKMIDENTIDDLLTVRPGFPIRHNGEAPVPLSMTDTTGSTLNGMELMRSQRDGRTGVTGQSQGMNPDSLNKTASGMAMLQMNADQIKLLVTRNFAEMLVQPMFTKRYRLMRAYCQPFKMKIEGKYTLVDPSKWPDDPDVQVNVGLGTGSKDQKIQWILKMTELQGQLVQAQSRVVDDEKLWNTAKAFVDATSIGVPSDFFNDPAQFPPPEPKPDPEVAKEQAKQQTQQAKDQQGHQQAMAKIAIDQQQAQAQAQLDAERYQAQIEADREKAALQLQLSREKAAEEARLAEQKFVLETSLAERRLAFDQKMAEKRHSAIAGSNDDLPSYRPGGALDA